jgi:hypothetical protein
MKPLKIPLNQYLTRISLIYADRGVVSAKELIMRTQQRSISVITYMEYVPFCHNKRELLVFEKMLKALQFTIHEIDHAISYYARQLVRQFALRHTAWKWAMS